MASPAPSLSRRQLLRLGLSGGALAALAPLLGGCRRAAGVSLAITSGTLPPAWLKALPSDWRARPHDDPASLLTSLAATPVPGLAALSDGWAGAVSAPRWQPFGAPELLQRLAAAAGPVSRLFAEAGAPPVAFPWAFSPWVILLRSRPDLQARAEEGWSLLLDPSLRQRLVLPSSPRVGMALVGDDFERLRRLRQQALAYDERDGLNLVLAGQAQAAVLPLRRLVPLLRRDQRLAVIWPASGAPLSWQLLLRPAASQAPLPLAWLGALLEGPVLAASLAGGWVPPLPREQLEPVVRRFPAAIASLLLPAPGLLERCWSLPPLDTAQRLALQSRWDAADPALGGSAP